MTDRRKTTRSPRFAIAAALGAGVLSLLGAGSASGLVISRFQTFPTGTPNPNTNLINNTAPAGDRGWSNLSDNWSGVYLGDHWFLAAQHQSSTDNFVRIAGGVFPLIPGTNTRITNNVPGLATQSDLRLFRIGVDNATGLSPEDLDRSIRSIRIADSLPSTNTDLTIFGSGGVRRLNNNNVDTGQTFFNASGIGVTSPVPGGFTGFTVDRTVLPPAGSDLLWQWGENRRTGGALNLQNGPVADTVIFRTRFDQVGLLNEAQGAAGDSGGPVFWLNSGEYVLAGLNHVVFYPDGVSPPNPPGAFVNLTSAFGAYTGISDLSNAHYRGQIEALRAQQNYSILGDIDLNGAVTGSITGGVASGDLGILAANWLREFTTPDIKSWRAGDLNQDALVNLEDFVILRDALGGSINSTDLAAVIAGVSIPEPGAALVAAAGLAALGGRRRG